MVLLRVEGRTRDAGGTRTLDYLGCNQAPSPLGHSAIASCVREVGLEPTCPKATGLQPAERPAAQLSLGVNDGDRTRYNLHHKQAPHQSASSTTVVTEGLEPPASVVSGLRSSQLSYVT